MDRRSKIIVGLFVVVLLGIIITEVVRPKPINWRESYTADDTIPFGCYVLYNELSSLFSNTEVKRIDESIYNTLSNRDNSIKSSYVLINNGINFDDQELNQILDYVSDGNEVFIASSYFGGYLSDTLNLEVKSAYNIIEDTVDISFTHPKLNMTSYGFAKGIYNRHFTSVDSLNTTILGYISYTSDDYVLVDEGESELIEEKQKKPNFVKIKFGKGNFYLNTTPIAFTNYHMLSGKHDYIAKTFSYLKQSDVLLWDNYKKSGRIIIDSPLRFILSQSALKWAYYLALLGILLFLIFKAKREQRIIPVIEPLENSSIEFAKTVGSLYYQHRDYTDLIAKKVKYFFEHIRSRYHLNTDPLTEKTAISLAGKSGKPIKETKELIDLIIELKNRNTHTEQDIIMLDKKITAFKK